MINLNEDQERRAKKLHEESLVIVATAFSYTLESPYYERIKTGGVDAEVITAAYEDNFESAVRKIDAIVNTVEKNPERFSMAYNTQDIRRIKKQGKVAIILGFQDTKPIGEDLAFLRTFHRLGVRMMQLTYTGGNMIGDGCGERTNRGLTFSGIELVEEMNRLGVIVDLGHCGDATTMDGIKYSRKTPTISHANVRALCNTMRNKTDEQIKALAARGGVMGFTPLPGFVHKERKPTAEDLLNHIEYVIKLVGIDHVGIGLDFIEKMQDTKTIFPASLIWRTRRPDVFGTAHDFTDTPYAEGIESVSKLPNLTRGLVAKGYSDEDIRKFLGENFLRVFKENWG
jgi:membrane dipeptidase